MVVALSFWPTNTHKDTSLWRPYKVLLLNFKQAQLFIWVFPNTRTQSQHMHTLGLPSFQNWDVGVKKLSWAHPAPFVTKEWGLGRWVSGGIWERFGDLGVEGHPLWRELISIWDGLSFAQSTQNSQPLFFLDPNNDFLYDSLKLQTSSIIVHLDQETWSLGVVVPHFRDQLRSPVKKALDLVLLGSHLNP